MRNTPLAPEITPSQAQELVGGLMHDPAHGPRLDLMIMSAEDLSGWVGMTGTADAQQLARMVQFFQCAWNACLAVNPHAPEAVVGQIENLVAQVRDTRTLLEGQTLAGETPAQALAREQLVSRLAATDQSLNPPLAFSRRPRAK